MSSLYMHVPFCNHLCNYCDFYKVKYDSEKQQFKSYHEYLMSTAKIHQDFLKEYEQCLKPLETLYLGGGTPSLWGVDGARFFKTSLLEKHFSLKEDVEFTMEMDPGAWNEETYFAWKELGVNRWSLGTQAFDQKFVEILDRKHTLEETKELLNFLSEKKENFSVDFLLGVPHSQRFGRNIEKELDELLSYNPSHLSLYILKTRGNYPLKTEIPLDDYIRDEYLKVSDYLKAKGFEHYEVSNFAKPGLRSRHNIKYWNQESVLGLGPNATGFFRAQEGFVRYQWGVESQKLKTELLKPSEALMEKVYLALRMCKPLKLKDFFPISDHDEALILKEWEQSGFFDASHGNITSLGFLMSDTLMNQLFSKNLL